MTGPATPADPQRRLRAFVVDQALVAFLGATAASVALVRGAGGASAWLTGFLVAAAVSVGFGALAGVTTSSPGRWIAGTRLVGDGSGAPVGAARGAVRSSLLTLTGWATAGTGWLVLALSVVRDEEGGGRGWHDRLCGTRVTVPRCAERVVAPQAAAARGQGVDRASPGVVDLTALRAQQPVPVPPPRSAPGMPLPDRWQVVVEAVTPGAAESCHDVTDRLRWGAVEFALVRGGALAVRPLDSGDGVILVRGGAARTVEPGRVATLLPGDRVCVDGRWAGVRGAEPAVRSG